jgi:hypothetical protein
MNLFSYNKIIFFDTTVYYAANSFHVLAMYSPAILRGRVIAAQEP